MSKAWEFQLLTIPLWHTVEQKGLNAEIGKGKEVWHLFPKLISEHKIHKYEGKTLPCSLYASEQLLCTTNKYHCGTVQYVASVATSACDHDPLGTNLQFTKSGRVLQP